ncbi:hypothetical protein TNCV_4223751 [Trichonephila clavipes]|nr:hypothetical protein TNCV_4223751 [Trichonephila clavipes]
MPGWGMAQNWLGTTGLDATESDPPLEFKEVALNVFEVWPQLYGQFHAGERRNEVSEKHEQFGVKRGGHVSVAAAVPTVKKRHRNIVLSFSHDSVKTARLKTYNAHRVIGTQRARDQMGRDRQGRPKNKRAKKGLRGLRRDVDLDVAIGRLVENISEALVATSKSKF